MGRYVTLLTLHDPVRAEMLKDILSQEGIGAMVNGAAFNALYGAAGLQFASMRLQVNEDDLERAHELITALENEESELVDAGEAAEFVAAESEKRKERPVDDGGDGPYRRAGAEIVQRVPKRKFIAGGLSLVITFGSGHFYAGEKGTGALLLVAQLIVLFLGFREPLAHLAVPALMMIDFVGSSRAVDRASREARLGAGGDDRAA